MRPSLEGGSALQRWSARALAVAVLGQAAIARACPVCFSAKDEAQRQAFFDTTIFLTLLPVAMIGGIAYWIAKRSAHIAADSTDGAEAERAAAAPLDPPHPGGTPAASSR